MGKKNKYAIAWILAAVVILLIRGALSTRPEWVEHYYSRGLFLVIRQLIDATVARLPIPLIYVFFLVLIPYWIWKIIAFFKKRQPALQKLGTALLGLLATLSQLLIFFLLLWGFNYLRVPVSQNLGLQLQPIPIDSLQHELDWISKKTIAYRAIIADNNDSIPLSESLYPVDLETHIRSAQSACLADHEYPVKGRVRVRRLRPRGIFMRFSSSGLYWPFVGEGNVDAGLLKLQHPFVMAHEMAHGQGFSDEGICNFWAFATCHYSEDPYIKYSGYLGLYRYIASAYLRYFPKEYRAFRQNLPLGLQADLNAINENMERYPDIMPKLRYHAYDAYLKTQGVEEGMKSYSQIVMLVKSWRASPYYQAD